jgi:glycosyltransferase involved in cell wall biosynthesis
MTTASIIIATYNRADLLDECLTHLAQQQFEPDDTVLIADNGSTDHTAAVVARHAADFPVSLRRIFEPTPGKSYAVAAALSVATGDIIALTDDDVRVTDEWLVHLKGALADSHIGLVGGPVEPHWQRPAPRWLQLAGHRRLGAPLGLLDYGAAPTALGQRTLLGANMAVRRSVLLTLGGYATHLGKLRGTLLSGEDHELCERVQAAGFGARYVPAARVRHLVPAERMRIRYFLHWFYWSGVTKAAMETQRRQAHAWFGVPAHLLRQFVQGLAGAAASVLRGRTPAAVDRALDSAFALGYAASRLGLVRTPAPTAPSHTRPA